MQLAKTKGFTVQSLKVRNLNVRNGGFSMVELLVAVLVMGIGVLGVTGLQVVSLQNNRAALMQADATQLAYNMLDRIRANPEGAPRGQAYDGLALDADPPSAGNCVANNCSAAQMVSFDQALWKCQLGKFNEHTECVGLRDNDLLPANTLQPGLPNGDGAIEISGAGLIQVRVQWSGLDGALRTVLVESQG